MANTAYLSMAIISILAFGRAVNSDGLADASSRFDCFATTDLVRVFEYGYGNEANSQNTLEVFGIRNEIVSAQCFVQAYEDLKHLSISVSAPKQSEGTAVIPAENVGWNFVKSIFTQENTPKIQKSDLTRSAPAWFPDYLSDEHECSLKKDALKALTALIGWKSGYPNSTTCLPGRICMRKPSARAMRCGSIL